MHGHMNVKLAGLLSSCGTTLQDLSVITVLLVCIHLTSCPAVASFAFAKILNYNYCIFNITIVSIAFSWLRFLRSYSLCKI
jgi:hypothetical protein